MDSQHHHTLLTRLDHDSERNPEGYRARAALLAAAGHAALLLLGLLALIGTIKAAGQLLEGNLPVALILLVPPAMLAVATWRLLSLRRPAPRGVPLNASQAPKLFAMLDKIQTRLEAPALDQVILDDQCRASIQRHARLGPLGSAHSTLFIGLPLMQVLSRKELAAVLTHEYVQLAKPQDRLASWVLHNRAGWQQLHDLLASSPSNPFNTLLQGLLRTYLERLTAWSLPLARQLTHAADQLGAEIVGAQTMADALIASELRGRFINEEFWRGLWATADSQPAPTYLPFGSMRTALGAGLPPERAQAWLGDALRVNTCAGDHQPSLQDRLLALDTPAELPLEAAHCAAQSLFGEQLPLLQRRFDQRWLSDNEEAWRERHREVSAAREITRRLAGRDTHHFAPSELEHYAQALITVGRNAEAVPLLRRAADHPHGSARIALQAAHLLRSLGDEAAIHYFELAMDRDAQLIRDTTAQVVAFCTARGDEDRASYYQDRLARLQTA